MRSVFNSQTSAKRGIVTIFLAVALIVLTLFRLMMSLTLHMFFARDQLYDDVLLMRQSRISAPAEDDYLILAKNRGYGWYIKFFSATGLPADLWQFIMWLLAAITVAYALWRVFCSPAIASFAYLYVIWNPIAFENWLGIRLYRNSLFAPLLFLLLGLAIILFDWFTPLLDDRLRFWQASRPRHARLPEEQSVDTNNNVMSYLGYAVIVVSCGFIGAVMYALKEDSAWLLPLLAFITLYKIWLIVRSRQDRQVKVIACLLSLCMPLTFVATVAAAKSANQRDFGVSLLNTRTQGELAGFVARVYKIDNPEQTPQIWAPATSIEQAFQASPTLQQNPELQWNLEHIAFAAPDIREQQLEGDFLTWQLRIALNESGQWENEESMQQLFAQVNGELDAAFESGELKETEKLSPSAMVVPRTKRQILEIVPQAIRNFYHAFDPRHVYGPGVGRNVVGESEMNILGLQQMNVDPNDPNPEYFRFLTFERAGRLALALMRLYVVLNYCLLAVMLIAIINRIHRRKQPENYHQWRLIIFSMLMMLYGLAYCFSVAWFAQFMSDRYVFYFYSAGAVVPFIGVGLLICAGVTLDDWQRDLGEDSRVPRISLSLSQS